MNDAEQCKYRPGQIWEYKTRSSEPLSTLTILKITTAEWGETIVHIAINHLHLIDNTGEAVSDVITHTVVSPEVLNRSVTKLVTESGPIPDFAEGYADWQIESGGSFNTDETTVASVVTLIENAWCHGYEEPIH